MTRPRTLLRIALAVVLILISLLATAYLSRRLWFEPIVIARIEQLLRDELDADAAILGVGGNWVDSLVVDLANLRARGPGPLRSIERCRISARFWLPRLLNGDVSGLEFVRVEADQVTLDPASRPSVESAEPSTPFRIADLEPLLDLAPDGASIRIDQLRVGGTPHELHGPAAIEIAPATVRRRTIRAELPNARIEARIAADPGPIASLDIRVLDPGRVLRSLGLENDLADGEVEMTATGDAESMGLAGRLQVAGVRVPGAGDIAVKATFSLDAAELRAPELSARLSGVRVDCGNLVVPVAALGDARAASASRGACIVEIDDLGPFANLIPDDLRELMPITANLRAFLADGVVTIGNGFVRGRGVNVRTLSGTIPVDPEAFRAGNSRIAVSAFVPEPREFRIPGAGPLVVHGTVHGSLTGSITDPRAVARLDLGSGSFVGIEWRSLTGSASYSEQVIEMESLELRDARPVGHERGSSLAGGLAVRLPTESAPATRIEGDVRGRIAPVWFALTGMADERWSPLSEAAIDVRARVDLEPGIPVGTAEVRLAEWRVDEGDESEAVFQASLHRDGEVDRTFRIDASGRLQPALARLLGARVEDLAPFSPVECQLIADGSFGASSFPAANAKLTIGGLRVRGSTPLAIDADVRLDRDGILAVDNLRVSGPVEVDAAGVVPLATATDAELHVRVGVPDLGVVRTFVPDAPELLGNVDAVVSLVGPLTTPTVDLELRGAIDPGAMLGSDWPTAILGPTPETPMRVAMVVKATAVGIDVKQLDAHQGDDGVERFRLSAAGQLPLAWESSGLVARRTDAPLIGTLRAALPPGETIPAILDCGFVIDADALMLRRLRLSTTTGRVEGSLGARGLVSAITGNRALDDVELNGRLTARQFDLSSLPPSSMHLQTLEGELAIDAELSGTLGRPEPVLDLRIARGRIKTTGLPFLTDVRTHIRVDSTRAEFVELAATMGGGKLTAGGHIEAPSGQRLTDATAPTVDLRVVGDEVLVLRSTGLTLRANADLHATGTLADIRVGGRVTTTSGKLIRRISLVPQLGARGGAGTSEGIQLFSIPPPLGPNIHFDVAINTQDPFELVTHVFNAPLALAVRLRGTGAAPFLDGAFSASSGSLRLPAMGLAIDSALLTFSADRPRFPDVLLKASGRRHGIAVQATVTGSLESPEILLSSLPPLTSQELIVLVSTGALPETLAKRGVAGQVTMVGTYFAQELLDFYFGSDSTERQESIFDRFYIESGREISRNGVESVTVEFKMTDSFLLQAERDMYEDYNMGLLFRLRFR